MPIERVLRQHGHILANVEALETLVSGPRPDRLDDLGFRRWMFTRDLLTHFAKMEGQVYGPLMDDVGGEAARRAGRASAETAAIAADFREHATRWHGFPPMEQWETYCRAIRWLTGRIRVRIESEAEEIVPLLGRLPLRGDECPRQPDQRYLNDAWEIRRLIFPGKGSGFVVAHDDDEALDAA